MKIHHSKKYCRNNRGFTLIEVLVALAIASIGFLGVASMVNRTNQGSINGMWISSLNNAATFKMESISLKAFDRQRYIDTYPTDASLDYTDDITGPHVDSVNNPPYTFTWRVAKDTPITNATTITLDVDAPPNRSGNPIKTVRFERVVLDFFRNPPPIP